MNIKTKTISLYFMSGFYVIAGINHFVNPQFYYPLIPDYLPYHSLLNILSGFAEIILGLLLLLVTTRKLASYGIIAMLILFIPAHIHLIDMGGCIDLGLCVPLWVAWVRLVPLQLLLMYWAWWHRK
ncbi:MAG: hypothetical protein ACFCUU_15580 [Cyclobacteriaceae bacterium]